MDYSLIPFWLSRLAAAAVVVYLYAAYRSWAHNPRGQANRLSVLTNLVFALWAMAAVFWYGAETADQAQAWYRAFGWTWCMFPPLTLHFYLAISRHKYLQINALRIPGLILLYLPGLVFSWLMPGVILGPPEFRAGYWILSAKSVPSYYLFSAHYFLYIIIGIFIVERARRRSRSSNERNRLGIVVWTSSIAIMFGFITDGLFMMIGIDFPNLAIFWILLLSTGMLAAMNRFGFLSPQAIAETPRILNALADMILFLDETGAITWANRRSIEAAGCSRLEEVKGKGINLFLGHKEAESVELTARGKLDFYTSTTQWGIHKIPVNLRARTLIDLNQAHGAIVMALDMSTAYALEKAEHQAADSGLIFHEFIEHSLDGIILTDADANISTWNAPMVSLTGLSASEALGRKLWEVLGELQPEQLRTRGDTDSLKRAILTALLGSPSPWVGRVVEQRIQHRDGHERIMQSSSFVIPLRGGSISATISRDITDSRRAAEDMVERIRKLDHAQKMDAVGSLTSGIAHDFNNTLAGIVGSMSLIRMGQADKSYSSIADIERELAIIERSANRATASVERLLTLTKKRLPETKTFNLIEAIKRVSDFATRSIDSSVSIELPAISPVAMVNGDSGLIEQLLLNLLINAEQAMTIMRPKDQKRGGSIRVDLSLFQPDQEFLAVNPAATAQDYWRISVCDEGVGIPHHILPHIFDPFYSTKASEKANGLGLSMVHSISVQHSGFVSVQSKRGQGSCFLVYLPVSNAAQDPVSQPAALSRGSGLIMLVDDDSLIRDTASAMLAALGYQTELAASGEEALDLFQAKPERWTAVVMDLRMSGMDGDEAATYMRSIRPDLPVVLASGFISEEALEATRQQTRLAVIQKPYSVELLSQTLAQMIRA